MLETTNEDKFDRVAVQRGWVGHGRDHTRFSRYHLLSNRTDGTPHRLVRNGRHKDGVNAWRRLHMEYAPVTSATAQGFMKKSLEIAQSEDNIRREQRDPDAGRTGAEVRRAQRQEVR